MEHIDYETALRALNEAVKDKGYKHLYNRREGAGCWNVTLDGEPDCIVGRALVWLGVPAQWFLPDELGYDSGRRGASAPVVCRMLTETDTMEFTGEAATLFKRAQVLQDGGKPWGEAVVRAHLNDDIYAAMHLDRDVASE